MGGGGVPYIYIYTYIYIYSKHMRCSKVSDVSYSQDSVQRRLVGKGGGACLDGLSFTVRASLGPFRMSQDDLAV